MATNSTDGATANSTDDRSSAVRAVGIIFVIFAWFFVGLRCYVRISMTRLFRIDDWLAVITTASYTVYCMFVILGANYGTGRHQNVVSKTDFQTAMMLWYGGELTYVITTCLLKTAIGVFLMQICVQKRQLWVIRVTLITFGLYSIYYLLLMMFQCSPVQYFWLQFLHPDTGTCLPTTIIADSTYAHGVLSAVTDWVLGVLPVFLVWNLNMNPRTKISVALILALGAIGSTASIIRMPYIAALNSTHDFLYDNTDVSIWSTVETGLGLTASSMACLRPLFQAFLSRSRLLGSSNQGPNATWSPGRAGYVRSNNDNGGAGIPLGNSAKATAKPSRGKTLNIDVRRVGDLERGTDIELVQGRSASSTTLTGHDSWNTNKRSLAEDSGDENGKIHVTEEVRVEVVHSNV